MKSCTLLAFTTFLFAQISPVVAAENSPPPDAAESGVKVSKPTRPEGGTTIRLPARTAPAEQASIFSRATGVISERRVDIGDTVKAGDILAVIDAPEIDRQIERARAGVAQAEANAALSRVALTRARAMAKNNVIAAEELDEREAGGKTAAADLLAAQAELNRLLDVQSFQTLRAPFDGVVSGRQVDRGDHVRGDQFQPEEWLFQLVRIDELRVELDAPPSAALQLRPGQAGTVTFSELPGRSFSATVTRASRVIDTESGTMRVEMLLPNEGNVLPAGLSGIATITADATAAALQIPTNALLVRDGRNMVAKVQAGKIAFLPVQVGRNLGTKIEILSGLSPDDNLILSPNALLTEGQSVP